MRVDRAFCSLILSTTLLALRPSYVFQLCATAWRKNQTALANASTNNARKKSEGLGSLLL
jgi:hypothetical protein